ncbi:hypothetical protein [Bradyrhizobium acaciae]|uniref:hypothetical protein n=1 Tax=Bradyrhizobium acaciae TaxID=2683706 RepID=UPI001E626322|nr:hypothetical protein [Bradyrhizobium acaciae]MCC8980428.1 hypothetical protein [Bradyrhizobium acaciae]
MQKSAAGAKAYREFAAHDRSEGWNAWMTFAISPSEATAAKPLLMCEHNLVENCEARIDMLAPRRLSAAFYVFRIARCRNARNAMNIATIDTAILDRRVRRHSVPCDNSPRSPNRLSRSRQESF